MKTEIHTAKPLVAEPYIFGSGIVIEKLEKYKSAR
jgi:hypothetical protein